MPLFQARPVVVEAYEWKGNTLNLDGAFNAMVLRYAPSGSATIRLAEGTATVRVGDWLVRGATGVIVPMTAAGFEAAYGPIPAEPMDEPRVKRAYNRKDPLHV